VTATTPADAPAPARAPFSLIPLGASDAAACEGYSCVIPAAGASAPGTPASAPVTAAPPIPAPGTPAS
jgi:hypothetical protein